MNADILLFALRLISGLLLLLLLFVLLVVMWRDYRSVTNDAEVKRRKYGRLIQLQEIDGAYVVTGESYPLLPLTSLGRSPTNTVPINDTFASSEHALVSLRDGQWWLEDRQSRNGTTLNEMAIDQPIIVTDGDVIGIGHLRYRLEMES
ncbi:MAG: FHA domain-containing protein [Burkholderiales bacterium]|nr:FHA domain-containing protein [Anaerolineae bacterium]